ncbi:MAG: NAD(+) diphosphatase [Thalassobius sp.]|nr:NAD(+) diphosphatase [Thalassovita sp.]
MDKEKNQLTFIPGFKPDINIKETSYIVFYDGKLMINKTQENAEYIFNDLPPYFLESSHKQQHLGSLHQRNCKIIGLRDIPEALDNFEFVSVRSLFGQITEAELLMAGRANQIITWATTHHFCGKCGTPTENKPDELAIICPNCSTTYYPTISPAIIVAIVKDGKILLGHSARFKGKFYSVLAGFLEIGETFEQCVAREVKEEAGVNIKNIKYFGSQPWPFPSSMMVGFTAEWDSGDIVLHDEELDDAGWFSPDDMPNTPGTYSIAGRLIEWFKQTHS